MGRAISDWPLDELKTKLGLVEECMETFGVQAARELMEKLGFPIPPPELITPVEQLEQIRRAARLGGGFDEM
jgi:hypothetical protein